MVERNALTEASAACAPGASITRRRKPSDARGGSASDDAAQPSARAAPPARILQSRVDALELGFRGQIANAVREMLSTALVQAKELHLSTIAVTIGPHEFVLSARSREGWWNLENRDAAMTIDEGTHLAGWSVGVQLRAMTLAAQSPAECAALAGDMASHVVDVIM